MKSRVQQGNCTLEQRGLQAAVLGESIVDTARKKMCVLMCDLVGSTELAYALETDDFHELMLGYYQICGSHIENRGGDVIQYIGDAILSVFETNENSPQNIATECVSAGAQIIDYLRLNRVVGGNENHELRVRISVVSGIGVRTDLLCSNGFRQQAVFGPLPFLADRLKGLTAPNSIMVDKATAIAISQTHTLESVAAVELKGIPFNVPSWKVSCGNKAFVSLNHTT